MARKNQENNDFISFRTEIGPLIPAFRISLEEKGLLLGSCFSDEIGSRMRNFWWDVAHNPAGPLFNPASIAESIKLALDPEPDFRIFSSGGVFRSWLFSTSFAATCADECIAKCREASEIIKRRLHEAQFLVVTFGTSFIYELDGRVVANCHKQPAPLFCRRLLSVAEIVEIWENAIASLREVNPSLRIIFTVSPIRHLGDGLHENTLSKARLQLALDEIVCAHTEFTDYFPSYEILLDDLRDYRFYAPDMAHPSPVAVDYIWHHFSRTYLSASDIYTLGQIDALKKRMNHHPLIPDSPAAIGFAAATDDLLADFLSQHPALRTE